MRISFRQSGGVAGRVRACEIETEGMQADAGRALECMVRESGIMEGIASRASRGRDLQRYEIEVEMGRERFSARFDDLAVPPALAPLLDYLNARARPTPPAA